MRLWLLLVFGLLFSQSAKDLTAFGVNVGAATLLSEKYTELEANNTNPSTAPILASYATLFKITSSVASAKLRLDGSYPELKRFCVFNTSANAVQLLAPSGAQIGGSSSYGLPSERFVCLFKIANLFLFSDYGSTSATDSTTGNPLLNWLEDSSKNFTQGSQAANIVFSNTDTGIRFSNTNPFIRTDSSDLIFRTSSVDRWKFTSTGNLESVSGNLVFTNASNKIMGIASLKLDTGGGPIVFSVNNNQRFSIWDEISVTANMVFYSGRIDFAGDATISSGSSGQFNLRRGTTNFLTFDGNNITLANPVVASSLTSSGDLTLGAGSSNSIFLKRGTTNIITIDGSNITFANPLRVNSITSTSSVNDLVLDAPSGRQIKLQVGGTDVVSVSGSAVSFSVPFQLSSVSSSNDLELSSGASNAIVLKRGTNEIFRFSDRFTPFVPLLYPYPTAEYQSGFQTPVRLSASDTGRWITALGYPTIMAFQSSNGWGCNALRTPNSSTKFPPYFKFIAPTITHPYTPPLVRGAWTYNVRDLATLTYILPYGGRILIGDIPEDGACGGGSVYAHYLFFLPVTSQHSDNSIYPTWTILLNTPNQTSNVYFYAIDVCFANLSGSTVRVWYGAHSENAFASVSNNYFACVQSSIYSKSSSYYYPGFLEVTVGFGANASDLGFYVRTRGLTKDNNIAEVESHTFTINP